MSSVSFLSQVATQNILLRVTNMCAECYSDLHEGDTIHYDMQSFRYLCDHCYQEISADNAQEERDEYGDDLFS